MLYCVKFYKKRNMKTPFLVEYKNIFTPSLVTILAAFMFSTVDTFFIAKLGEKQLASIGLVFPLIIFGIILLNALSNSVSINVSRAFGANQKERVKIKLYIGILISLTVSSILFLILFFGENLIFKMFQADADIINYAKEYFCVWVYGIPIMGLASTFSYNFNSIGLAKLRTKIDILILLLNISLDYILIFGKFGLPEFGLAGAALASVMAQFINLVVLFYILYSKNFIIYKIKNKAKFFVISKKILRLSIPFLIKGTLFPISMISVSIAVSYLSTSTIAAYSVLLRMEHLFLVVSMATTASTSVLVSKFDGAKKYPNISKTFIYGNYLIIVWGVLLLLINLFFGSFVGSLFLNNSHSIQIFNFIWFVSIWGYISYGLMANTNKVMMVMNRPYYATSVSISRSIMFLILPFIFTYMFELNGFIYSILFINITAFLFSLFLYKKHMPMDKIKNKNMLF